MIKQLTREEWRELAEKVKKMQREETKRQLIKEHHLEEAMVGIL